MEKRTLGSTGLDVTLLGYGAAELRGPRSWGGRQITDAEAERILNEVLDAGINLVDTAPDYGLSETFIGRYISHRRDEYYLASKCGCTIVDQGEIDDFPHYFTRDNLLANIDATLRITRCDYIDIWQPHTPSVHQLEENRIVDVMREVQETGKVRHLGLSATLPHNWTFVDWGVFETFQIPYSALERREETLITKAVESGAGTIIRGGVARGEPGVGVASEAAWEPWTAAGLDELRKEGETRTSFLLRFTISHPNVHTTIVATMNPLHLAENLRTIAQGPLAPQIYAEAKRRLAGVGQRPVGLA